MPTFVERGAAGGVEAAPVAPPGVPAGLTGDSARVAANVTLADNIGRFVASQVLTQYGAENIAERLNRRGGTEVSVGWG